MVRCGSKNKHKKNMCSIDIRLFGQKLLTITSSIMNIIGREGVI